MNDLIKKILVEWSFRLDDGIINLNNPKHMIVLSEVLKDMKLPTKVILEVVSNITEAKLFCNYIFLDTKERKNFAQSNHEYLITQIQSSRNNSLTNYTNLYNANDFESIRHKVDMRFTYPVKEIFWTIQNSSVSLTNDWNNYWLSFDKTSRFDKENTIFFVEAPVQAHNTGGALTSACTANISASGSVLAP